MAKTRTLRVKVALDEADSALELEETIQIRTDTFAEAASVLTQFHELLERIRDGQAGVSK